MKILLIGRDGQLARALAPELSKIGDVVAWGRSEIDLADPRAAGQKVLAAGPDLVVNTAAYTAVDQAEAEAELAMTVNGQAPGELARAARETGGAIIHYSTDYVFDGDKKGRYDEDDATQPINQYGRSKRAGEEAIVASGAPHLILRTTWLYGSWGRNFLTTMLRLGAERREISVVDDQIGTPTSVGVVAGVTADILNQAGPDAAEFLRRVGGIVHVACQGETSWHGFAGAIFDAARRRKMPLKVETLRAVSSQDFGAPARRPQNSRLSLARLKDRFGIVTPDWRDALAEVFSAISS